MRGRRLVIVHRTPQAIFARLEVRMMQWNRLILFLLTIIAAVMTAGAANKWG